MNGNCVEIICLPLYTLLDGAKTVLPNNGLNLWKAGGRVRNENEIAIPIPQVFKMFFPVFFPESREFELRLPNYVTLSAKLTKDGNHIVTNPSKDLGRWLLRQVLRIPAGNVVTYEMLEKKGIDAVYFEKWIEGNEVYYKIFPAPLGEYETFVNGGIKERKEVLTPGSRGRFGAATVQTAKTSIKPEFSMEAGDKIVHKAFGEGVIKSVDNDMVELDFDGTTKSFKLSWLVQNKIITPA